MKIKTHYLDSVDSTNIFAKQNLHLCKADTLLAIYTSYQTSGLGTNERGWISPKGENLLVTFVFATQKESQGSQYTQVMSVALIHTLETLGLAPQIKWPNDILLNGKKVAGLLAEPQTTHQKMVLGVGLNVNMKCFDKIDQPATSIFDVSNTEHKIEDILNILASNFEAKLTLFHAKGFDPILTDYAEHLAYVDQHVKWNNIEGILRSVSVEGYLLIEDLNHHMHCVKSGSITPLNRE